MSKHIAKERRVNRRYPLELELSYRLLGSDSMMKRSGISYNIGSRGLLFRADTSLQPDDEIELIIHWPAVLNDTTLLNLAVWGRVIRNNAKGCAMRICGHEFRTRASAPVARAAATTMSKPCGLSLVPPRGAEESRTPEAARTSIWPSDSIQAMDPAPEAETIASPALGAVVSVLSSPPARSA
jgi:hypothetical protein